MNTSGEIPMKYCDAIFKIQLILKESGTVTLSRSAGLLDGTDLIFFFIYFYSPCHCVLLYSSFVSGFWLIFSFLWSGPKC